MSSLAWAQPVSTEPAEMIVVVGAGGEPEYETQFLDWADQWKAVADTAGIEYGEIGRDGSKQSRDELKARIDQTAAKSNSPFWLVFIGHGTYDREAKFNLSGPDLSAAQLKAWLSDLQRPLIVVNSFSCSGAFLKDLRGENRVIITATRSGAELNYSRFGGFLAESLDNLDADLDHDDQVSLLEAYLFASSQVARFYESESRLATEHSLLEDNNDGKGTSADFFVGIRVNATSKSGARPDGRAAHRYILASSEQAVKLTADQLAERDRLETAIEQLRDRKSSLHEDAYYGQLEPLMLELARLYNAESANP